MVSESRKKVNEDENEIIVIFGPQKQITDLSQ